MGSEAAAWGAVFNRFCTRGLDPSDAAYRADQWEKRQHRQRWEHCCSTHCERGQECRSPNDCAASLKRLREPGHDEFGDRPEAKNPFPTSYGAVARAIRDLSPAERVKLETTNLLDKLARHPNWELSCPYTDDDEQDELWVVHKIVGGINDREWIEIGRGETPEAALASVEED